MLDSDVRRRTCCLIPLNVHQRLAELSSVARAIARAAAHEGIEWVRGSLVQAKKMLWEADSGTLLRVLLPLPLPRSAPPPATNGNGAEEGVSCRARPKVGRRSRENPVPVSLLVSDWTRWWDR